jgi:transposase-like protein
MTKRRTHSPEFKARVAMEAISGRKTLQEIAADGAEHLIQASQWKKQLLEGASGPSVVIRTSGSRTRPCLRQPRGRVEKCGSLERLQGNDHGLAGFLCRRSTMHRMVTGPVDKLLGG